MNSTPNAGVTPNESPRRDQSNLRTDFDFTRLSTFTTCPRKYDYQFNKGKRLKVPQTALDFGSGIHLALDEWYTSRDVEKSISVFKEAYTEQLDIDNKRTHELGEWMIRNYDTVYRDQPWKVVATEMPFTIPLGGDFNFIGRIDKVIEWNDTIWIVDHKTTSSLGPTYTRMAEPNAQFTGYVWAARKLGHNARGIIIDALLTANGILQASSRARLTPTLRYDSYRTDEALAEWEVEFMRTLAHLRDCELTSQWPADGQFNGGCTYYGECPYRRVCCEDKGLRDRLLEADYKVEFWDPRD